MQYKKFAFHILVFTGLVYIFSVMWLSNFRKSLFGSPKTDVGKVDLRPEFLRKLFNYSLEPNINCSTFSNDSSSLLIFVKSALSEFEERQTVRDTWGAVAKDLNIPVIFAVGDEHGNNGELLTEHSRFGDLLVADYPDIYDNMPLKTLSVLTWYSLNIFHRISCPEMNQTTIPKLFSTDTDVIVMPENLKKFVSDLPSGLSNVITGHCWLRGASVNRDKTDSKHYVSRSTWAGDRYPPYCSGSGFLLTGDVIVRLVAAIPASTSTGYRTWLAGFEHLNDVLYTGIIRELAGVQLKHTERVVFYKIENIPSCDHQFISAHNYKPRAVFVKYWRKFRTSFLQCGPIKKDKPYRILKWLFWWV